MGVLNTRNYLRLQKKKTGKCTNRKWCPVACFNITRLCRRYNARIVISSSWRHQYSLQELRKIFSANGITEDYIVGVTPSIASQSDGQNYCRGHEIKDWLDNNALSDASFIIIDDASDLLKSQQKYFIQVNLDSGFANPDAMMKALQLLGAEEG